MEKVQQVQAQALEEIKACEDLQQLQQIRVTTLGEERANSVADDDDEGSFPEEKPAFGQEVNECKKAVAAAIEVKMAVLEKAAMKPQARRRKIDITLPGAVSHRRCIR